MTCYEALSDEDYCYYRNFMGQVNNPPCQDEEEAYAVCRYSDAET